MRASVVVTVLLTTSILAGCIGGTDDLEIPEDPIDPVVEATGVSYHMPVPSFEPTIGVTSSGALFVTGGATGAGPWHQTLFRSTDQGHTWEDVTANLGGVVNYPPNSNDPYVFVDRDTDRIFDFEMQGLSCNMLAYSDDDANTWEARPLGCTPTQVIQDHQTIFSAYPREVNGFTPEPIGYEKILYYCVNRVVDSGCAFSLDSGLTWSAFRPLVYQGVHPENFEVHQPEGLGFVEIIQAVDRTAFSPVCGGLHAHGQASPSGILYLPRDYCGYPSVAISKDNSLTWDIVRITDKIGSYPGDHETTIGVDEDGNVFAAWLAEDMRVWFAASYDEGYTWTEAQQVSPDPINLTFFPVITAGGPGKVAIAYIGSEADGSLYGYGNMTNDQHWDAYITYATGLENGTEDASWNTVQVNPEDDPIARGVCGNTRCQASGGGLGDFIDIEIDNEGRPWAAYVDVCHEECLEASPDAEGSVNDKALGLVGTLSTGPALRGDALDLLALAPMMADHEHSTSEPDTGDGEA